MTDFCAKNSVVCKPLNPCLIASGCVPASGRCKQLPVPDGTPCDDGREYTVADQCQRGLCIGRVVSLCDDRYVVCEASDDCHDMGVCDHQTGMCSEVVALDSERRSCDDGDPSTHGDVCIDGICVGEEFADPKFMMLGNGDCVDRDQREMPRYYGDVASETECRQVCAQDVQCQAYSFAYPLCSIYGTIRLISPDPQRWAFQPASIPSAVSIEMVKPPETGQRVGVCRRKGANGDLVEDPGADTVDPRKLGDPIFLCSFFAICLLCFCARPLWRTSQRLFCPDRLASKATISPAPKVSQTSEQ